MIDALKAQAPPKSVVYSFDEKAKIPIKDYNGYVYTKARRVKWSCKQKVKGLLEMPAAINVHTGAKHWWFYDWKNAFVVTECLQALLSHHPDEDVYVFIDNWRAHTGVTTQIFAALNPRLHLVFLPTNASWMNPIERIFGRLERQLLRNSNCQSVREMMVLIDNYFKNEPTLLARSS